MAKGLFSCILGTVAVQSPPLFPPLSWCLVLFSLWGLCHAICLHSLPKCILIMMLQAGADRVSHTVNDASWEIRKTYWLTLFSSKIP